MKNKIMSICAALVLVLAPVTVYADTEEATPIDETVLSEVVVVAVASEEEPISEGDSEIEENPVAEDISPEESSLIEEIENGVEEEAFEIDESTEVIPEPVDESFEEISPTEEPTPSPSAIEIALSRCTGEGEVDITDLSIPDREEAKLFDMIRSVYEDDFYLCFANGIISTIGFAEDEDPLEEAVARCTGDEETDISDLEIPDSEEDILAMLLSEKFSHFLLVTEDGIIVSIVFEEDEEAAEHVSQTASVYQDEIPTYEEETPEETAEIKELSSAPTPAEHLLETEELPARKSYPVESLLTLLVGVVALIIKTGGGLL